MASLSKSISAAILAGILVFGHAAPVLAYEDGDDAAMLVDITMLRPLGLAALVGGACVYVVSLPFQLTSWNFKDPFDALIKRPFHYTFSRDLGDENL